MDTDCRTICEQLSLGPPCSGLTVVDRFGLVRYETVGPLS